MIDDIKLCKMFDQMECNEGINYFGQLTRLLTVEIVST